MRIAPSCLAAVLSLAGVTLAQGPDRPITELPYTPGLDVKAMDRTADSCVDFYQFTCDSFAQRLRRAASHKVPPDPFGIQAHSHSHPLPRIRLILRHHRCACRSIGLLRAC